MRPGVELGCPGNEEDWQLVVMVTIYGQMYMWDMRGWRDVKGCDGKKNR